jgi:hypothetical protein
MYRSWGSAAFSRQTSIIVALLALAAPAIPSDSGADELPVRLGARTGQHAIAIASGDLNRKTDDTKRFHEEVTRRP